jgi:hypothetical protein
VNHLRQIDRLYWLIAVGVIILWAILIALLFF